MITIVTALVTTSCEDSSTVGSTLIDNNIEIVVDSTYTVSGVSVANPEVRSRTVTQLLGSVNIKGFGNLSSDVVTQFISSESIDTTGITINDIDSIKLILGMRRGSFVGDSVIPMGLSVYPLKRQLESPMFSNFNPEDYYDPADCWGSAIYAATATNLKNRNDYDDDYRYINVTLPLEFGRKIYSQYLTSPETFATPQAFTKWFPGLYIKNTFGNGRIISVVSTSIKMFYHRDMVFNGKDTTIIKSGIYMAVSPEVITNNNISYSMAEALKERADAGEAIVAAPVGYDVEFTFPARKIVEDFRNAGTPMAVINSLTFKLPAKYIPNDYNLAPPPYLLMIKKSKKDEFFAKFQLPNNIDSFYARYNTATGTYDFTSMLNYINQLAGQDSIDDEDIEFVLTPVTATFSESAQSTSSSLYYYYYGYGQPSSTQTLESLTPYVMTPVMCNLDFKNAKVTFTYSKQKI